MTQEFKGKFQLTHGIISLDDRITSRDTADPEYFGTKPEAEKSLKDHAEFYFSLRYKIWFSNIREWNFEKKEYR